MNASSRTFLKKLLPPAVTQALTAHRHLSFRGSYEKWSDAIAASSGYDEPAILDRVATAVREVVAGRAAFERDGVLFQVHQYPTFILAGLLRNAWQHDRLRVVDVGGALGSMYRQCRSFLPDGLELDWAVIEQPHFVHMGRTEFATKELSFHDSIDALESASHAGSVDAVLLSSVIQYLDRPMDMLDSVVRLGARHLIVDRSPVTDLDRDYLCVQRVPRSIYKASYPCWIFSRRKLIEHLSRDWTLIAEELSPEGGYGTDRNVEFQFRGFIFERRL